jgi:hypothetical protein
MQEDDLLQRAIEAHGGAERYRSAREMLAHVSSGGFAFTMRMQRGALANFEGRVSTEEPRSVLSPYPKAGQRGIFESDRVRIESEDGKLLSERRNPRAAFRGLRHNFWWDDLDLLYFAGYALWGYLNEPFLFLRSGFVVREIDPWQENGERWRRLEVDFPPNVPNHSRRQVFHFDERGLLRRLDYTAEVFGSWAKAAHYCSDHKELSGLMVPTRRRVFPRRRNGRPRPRPTIVWIDVHDLELLDGGAQR